MYRHGQTDERTEARASLSRARRRLIGAAGLAVSYYVFVRMTGRGIPCTFYALTGHWCPGCGISRMLIDLTQGNLTGAWQSNRLLLILTPYLALILIRQAYAYWNGRPVTVGRRERYVQIIIIVLLLAFGILRNVPAFSHWAPYAGSIP